MENRFFFALLLSLYFSGCAGKNTRDFCAHCPRQAQNWEAFSFDKLEGTWKGRQTILYDSLYAPGRVSKEKNIEVGFLEGKKFLRLYNVKSCEAFPRESIVFLKELYEKKKNRQGFEVFGRLESNKVNYGRVYIKRNVVRNECTYEELKGEVSMNRLAMPSVVYSRNVLSNRKLASGEAIVEAVQFEFLHFDDARVKEEFQWKGEENQVPLFFRFVRILRVVQSPFDNGKWQSTEEKQFQLWRKVN